MRRSVPLSAKSRACAARDSYAQATERLRAGKAWQQAGSGFTTELGRDGTIRYVADGLAHTGIPLRLVPAGTGNLLARNLDLPLEEVDAIEVALDGQVRQVDLVKITVDDRAPEHFAVMAGIGIDAVIKDETDEGVRDKAGSTAYFVAAAKALGRLPVRMTVHWTATVPSNATPCFVSLATSEPFGATSP
jgi:diacylglycerol kinase family enzyme